MSYRIRRILALAGLFAALALNGCANGTPADESSNGREPLTNGTAGAPETTEQPAEGIGTKDAKDAENTPDSPSAEAEPLDIEALRNDSGKTMLVSYTNAKDGTRHATVAIVSSQGTVAIADPHSIPQTNGRVPADIITVSHSHPDHNDPTYVLAAKEARVSVVKAESFAVKDIAVTGIAAAHYEGDVIPDAPSDVIYLFEVDGLRIAHFGDLGQEKLTEEQLEQLGEIDVAITRFSRETRYGASAAKTIALLRQVKPRLVLPSHFESETIDEVLTQLKATDRVETDKLLLDSEEIGNLESLRFVMLK